MCDCVSLFLHAKDVLSFGVPERPLTVGEEDKFATEVV